MQVQLKNKKGVVKSFPFDLAERILFSPNNKTGNWVLDDDGFKLGKNGIDVSTDKGSNKESTTKGGTKGGGKTPK